MGVYTSYLEVQDINVKRLEVILESMQIFSDCSSISKSRAIESFLKLIGMREHKLKMHPGEYRYDKDNALDLEIKDSIRIKDILKAYKSFLGYADYRIFLSNSDKVEDDRNVVVLFSNFKRKDKYKKVVSFDFVLLMMAMFILENLDKSYEDFIEVIGTDRPNKEVREFYGMFVKSFKKSFDMHQERDCRVSIRNVKSIKPRSVCDDCIHRYVCKYYNSVKYINTDVFNITCKYKE